MQSSLCSLLGLRHFIHKHHPVKNSIYHAIPRVSYYGDSPTKGEPRPKVSEERKSYASEFTRHASCLHRAGALILKSLSEVIKEREKSEAHWRIPMSGLFGEEVSRVLGGGLVPGSSVLIGGTPGVGKSTFSLQAAVTLAERGGGPVIYVSGEESITQIADRAIRMGISIKDILLCSNTNIEDILEKSRKMDPNPTALIIDSIQTIYMRGLHGSAGNPTQMKRCMSALLQYANETNIPVIVIGHVTKMGTLAGPRTLEHMVDVVLYVETERHSTYRLLRCVKNRFGSTDELGIFEMSKTGLQVALNTRDMFSRDPDPEATILAGHAFGVMIDESRTSIVEVQALCFSIPHGKEKVHVNGVQKTRANQIITVISMQTPLTPKNCIYLNVLSGVKLSGSAVDLPIAAAICSGCFGYPISNDIAFIGEIGLEGELRTVPRIDKRVKSVANLEFKQCIVPKESKKLLDELDLNIKILYCKNLIEMIETVFPFTKEKKYDSKSGLMKIGI